MNWKHIGLATAVGVVSSILATLVTLWFAPIFYALHIPTDCPAVTTPKESK